MHERAHGTDLAALEHRSEQTAHAERHPSTPPPTPGRLAVRATLHCLTGCAIGEVLGMVVGTALGWHDLETIALAVVLAFGFGYGLTMRPLLAAGVSFARATRLALAADTLSITIMEIVDNGVMLVIPGAMGSHLDQPLFWGALAAALAIAFVAALPANYWLIKRGGDHAHRHG